MIYVLYPRLKIKLICSLGVWLLLGLEVDLSLKSLKPTIQGYYGNP